VPELGLQALTLILLLNRSAAFMKMVE